jgi:hypothetical protein
MGRVLTNQNFSRGLSLPIRLDPKPSRHLPHSTSSLEKDRV